MVKYGWNRAQVQLQKTQGRFFPEERNCGGADRHAIITTTILSCSQTLNKNIDSLLTATKQRHITQEMW